MSHSASSQEVEKLGNLHWHIFVLSILARAHKMTAMAHCCAQLIRARLSSLPELVVALFTQICMYVRVYCRVTGPGAGAGRPRRPAGKLAVAFLMNIIIGQQNLPLFSSANLRPEKLKRPKLAGRGRWRAHAYTRPHIFKSCRSFLDCLQLCRKLTAGGRGPSILFLQPRQSSSRSIVQYMPVHV